MNILLETGPSALLEKIKDAFVNFSPINDAVDIFFLALTFFFIFSFFRGKKGGAVLIGITVCLVIWFLSTYFKLIGPMAKIFEKIDESPMSLK